MPNITNETASMLLGKKIEITGNYNPTILVAVPREENRLHYGIDCKNLPFSGFDVWHCYEFSCLCENGLPVTRLLKLRYNCQSKYIVESKSLKLYLNSFNMTKFGSDTKDCLDKCKKIIEADLTKKLETNVEVNFIESDCKKYDIFANYNNLTDYIDEKALKIEHYKETPELIESFDTDKPQEYYLTFDSLRSNCRVTHQPDFGDIFIYYCSTKHIKEDSLVKYLCSFRSEYHFHEECCEMIFKRISDILNPNDKLFVCALYTRRGGIDICPARWSKNFEPNEVKHLINIKEFARYGIKQ